MSNKCIECDCEASWVRRTQFAGDHFYCLEHAQREPDFGQENSCTIWEKDGKNGSCSQHVDEGNHGR